MCSVFIGMENKITFRDAFLHEADKINEINRSIFVENYTVVWIKKLIESRNSCVIVALDDKEIVGYILAALKNNNQQKIYGCIVSITVLPEYRRKGHAKTLIKMAEDKIMKMNIGVSGLTVRKSNKGAIKLYLSLGYARKKKLKKYYDAGTSTNGTEYLEEDGFFMIKYLS